VYKAAAGMELDRAYRLCNAIMSRYRIAVENVFGNMAQQWGFTQFGQNQGLGKQAVGKFYMVGMVLFNWHTILYGNQASCMYGDYNLYCELHDLPIITLEEYMDVWDRGSKQRCDCPDPPSSTSTIITSREK